MHNFKIFCSSGLNIVAFHVTLKHNFFSQSLSQYKSEKLNPGIGYWLLRIDE